MWRHWGEVLAHPNIALDNARSAEASGSTSKTVAQMAVVNSINGLPRTFFNPAKFKLGHYPNIIRC